MKNPDRFPGGWRRAADAVLARADASLTHRRAGPAVLLGALLAAGAWSVSLGVDANWDLHNYHLYNAYALLNGRYLWDVAPAGMQTYFHPLADLPFYLLEFAEDMAGNDKVLAAYRLRRAAAECQPIVDGDVYGPKQLCPLLGFQFGAIGLVLDTVARGRREAKRLAYLRLSGPPGP